jgi:NAD(P)H-dependent FMN reductase
MSLDTDRFAHRLSRTSTITHTRTALKRFRRESALRGEDRCGGFIFVTAEYNHSVPAVLKNALDYLYEEWNNKPAGFVSYGSAGGVRAAENLRLIAGELQIADVRAQVVLPFAPEFENFIGFTPSNAAEEALEPLLQQLIDRATALKTLRV